MPVWNSFLSREQAGHINAFLKKLWVWFFVLTNPINFNVADKRLFVKMCGYVPCLHSLLLPVHNYNLTHRHKGHRFELPRYSYDQRMVVRRHQLSSYGRRAFCVAGLEFSAGQLAESHYWREQFQTISEDVSVRNVLMHSAH